MENQNLLKYLEETEESVKIKEIALRYVKMHFSAYYDLFKWCMVKSSKFLTFQKCLEVLPAKFCASALIVLTLNMVWAVINIKYMYDVSTYNVNTRASILLKNYLKIQEAAISQFIELQIADIQQEDISTKVNLLYDVYDELKTIYDKGMEISSGTYIGYILKTKTKEEGNRLLKTIETNNKESTWLDNALDYGKKLIKGKTNLNKEVIDTFSEVEKYTEIDVSNVFSMTVKLMDEVTNITTEHYTDKELNKELQEFSVVKPESYPIVLNKIKKIPSNIVDTFINKLDESGLQTVKQVINKERVELLKNKLENNTDNLINDIKVEYDYISYRAASIYQSSVQMGDAVIPLKTFKSYNQESKEDITVGISMINIGQIVFLLFYFILLITRRMRKSKQQVLEDKYKKLE